MKTFTATFISFFLLSLLGEARGQAVFLVSSISDNTKWCITDRFGGGEFRNVGFRPCDFTSNPANQLWNIDAQGRFQSSSNPAECLIVNFGTTVFDGVRVRIGSCANTAPSNVQFTHNGATDSIRLTSNNGYCMTNRGTKPNPSDTMHMKLCKSDGRFLFTAQAQGGTTTSSDTGDFGPLKTDGGCVMVRNSNPRNDERFVLASCDGSNSQGFRSPDATATATFQVISQLDATKCMQAGRESPGSQGKKMRLFPCDASNALQTFEIFQENSTGAKIRLVNTNLCIDHRGTNANLGADPMILKSCDTAGRFETS